MKTLFLLRHASAQNHQTPFTDFDRPLDQQGWAEAKELANYWKGQSLTVDCVLCSAALRAQETLELLRPVVGTEKIEVSDGFYNISEDEILGNLQHLPAAMSRVLYIGHNPGLTFFVFKMGAVYPDFLNKGLDPATLVECQVPLDSWEKLAWKEGLVKELFHPTPHPPEAPSPKKL